jgi:hypothetical protein
MSVVRCALLLSLVFLPAAASAQSMNADTFYQKAMGLKKKGPMALFSGDIGILMREGQGAGKAAGLARKAALKAGTKPRYCPPSEVSGLDRHEYLDRLGRIPQAERRRIDITEATNRIMAGKFPCAA